jgi:O-antigen/teichoic acid export membrane protein
MQEQVEQDDKQVNNRRIAQNTLTLYVRTIITMCVSLYTSRVILDVLGIENYGVYQVVGGFVAMFSMISVALSTAISRFITYGIGSGDSQHLRRIFATSLAIQLVIAVIVVVLAESIGLWFLNSKISIPEESRDAAFWVFQCSVVTFCFGLMSVPYNACIIAHEHMRAFAYVSIIEVLFKLLVCYLIAVLPFNRLIVYAVLLAGIAIVIRVIYSRYCVRHFEESRTSMCFDGEIFRSMVGFAGWSVFNKTTLLLDTQGVNMLINIYFGVTMNAARGIASQVQGAVTQFVSNFTVAVNPQITKSYAAEQYADMYTLVCRSAKFSFYVMFFMALPIMCEIDQILHIWLKEVPDYTAIFVRLTFVMAIFDCIGSSAYTACMASGRLKQYSLIMSAIGSTVFIFTWMAFAGGCSVLSTYYVYIVVKVVNLIARTMLMQRLTGLKAGFYVKQALIPVFLVAIVAMIPSALIVAVLPASSARLILSGIVGCTSVAVAALSFGMTKGERCVILAKAKDFCCRAMRRQH